MLASDHHRLAGCSLTPDEAANHRPNQAQRSPAPEQARRSVESCRAFKKRKGQDQSMRGVVKALRWNPSLMTSSVTMHPSQAQLPHQHGVHPPAKIGRPHGAQLPGQ